MTRNKTPTVEQLLAEWEEGTLSRGSLAWLLLCCANFCAPEALLDAVPEEHRAGFAAAIECFPAVGASLVVGDRLDPPSEQAILALRVALSKRPGYGRSA